MSTEPLLRLLPVFDDVLVEQSIATNDHRVAVLSVVHAVAEAVVDSERAERKTGNK